MAGKFPGVLRLAVWLLRMCSPPFRFFGLDVAVLLIEAKHFMEVSWLLGSPTMGPLVAHLPLHLLQAGLCLSQAALRDSRFLRKCIGFFRERPPFFLRPALRRIGRFRGS